MGKAKRNWFPYLAPAALLLIPLGPATEAMAQVGCIHNPTCPTSASSGVATGTSGRSATGGGAWNPLMTAGLWKILAWTLFAAGSLSSPLFNSLFAEEISWLGKSLSHVNWGAVLFQLGQFLANMGLVAALIGAVILGGILLGVFGTGLASLAGMLFLGGLLVFGGLSLLLAIPAIFTNLVANPGAFAWDVLQGAFFGLLGAVAAIVVIVAVAAVITLFAPEGLFVALVGIAADAALSWGSLIMGAAAGAFYGAVAGKGFTWWGALEAGAGAVALGALSKVLEAAGEAATAADASGVNSGAEQEAGSGATTGFRNKVLNALGIDNSKGLRLITENKTVLDNWQRLLPKWTRIANRGMNLYSGGLGDIADTLREFYGTFKGKTPEGVYRDIQDVAKISRGEGDYTKFLTPEELAKMPREEAQTYVRQMREKVMQERSNLSNQRASKIQNIQKDLQAKQEAIGKEYKQQMHQDQSPQDLQRMQTERARKLKWARREAESRVQQVEKGYAAKRQQLNAETKGLNRAETRFVKHPQEPKTLPGESVWGGLTSSGGVLDQGQGMIATGILEPAMKSAAKALNEKLADGAFSYVQASANGVNNLQPVEQGILHWVGGLGQSGAHHAAHAPHHPHPGSAPSHGSPNCNRLSPEQRAHSRASSTAAMSRQWQQQCAADPARARGSLQVVRPGDTVRGGHNWPSVPMTSEMTDKVAQGSGIPNPNRIDPGQVIRIPNNLPQEDLE